MKFLSHLSLLVGVANNSRRGLRGGGSPDSQGSNVYDSTKDSNFGCEKLQC